MMTVRKPASTTTNRRGAMVVGVKGSGVREPVDDHINPAEVLTGETRAKA